MKKIISLSVAILMFVLFSVSSYAYNVSVEDNANLFTTDEYDMVVSSADGYSSATDISLAVLTIDNAQGLTSEDYAVDYHDNLIDNEGWSEDCILLMIDMDNRNVWVTTTGRAESIYYDADLIIDGGYDALVNGFYAKAVVGMIDSASYYYSYDGNSDDDYLTGDYNTDGYYDDGYYDADYDDYTGGTSDTVDASDILIYILVGLGVGGITVFAVKSRYKNFGKGDEFGTDDVFLNLTGSNDTVISRNVVTTKIPRNNNNHRPGGSSGGGMRHSGGGGRSHGGGGRGF